MSENGAMRLSATSGRRRASASSAHGSPSSSRMKPASMNPFNHPASVRR